MKRILVIGCPGSGKSTFSRELSQNLNLSLIHLDHLHWKPGWVEAEQEEFDRLLQTELEKECWIIDGNYMRTFSHRIQYADTVIFLDFNRWICAWRVIKRWLFQEGYQATGCPQKVDLSFLKFVLLDYPKSNRPQTLKIKNECKSNVEWITYKK